MIDSIQNTPEIEVQLVSFFPMIRKQALAFTKSKYSLLLKLSRHNI